MITLLAGSNFTGRSAWLQTNRASLKWPEFAALGPTAENAFSGLAWNLGDELRLGGSDIDGQNDNFWTDAFGLSDLFSRELYVLSGGETVRAALASTLTQNVSRLDIDCALEQLDEAWRAKVIALFTTQSGSRSRIPIYLIDNHITSLELPTFETVMRFPIGKPKYPAVSPLHPPDAAEFCPGVQKVTVALKALTFAYPRQSNPVFSDVTLSLDPGQIYVLNGENGSGKTTLTKLLCGALIPTHGVISIENQIFNARQRYRFASFASQNPDFQFSRPTVANEFTSINPILTRAPSVLLDILSAFGIPNTVLYFPPIDCPFVVRKRLGIALAMLAPMPMVILDEPTIGQDEAYRSSLVTLVTQQAAAGRTFLIISHDQWFKSKLLGSQNLYAGGGKIGSSPRSLY